MFLSAHCLGPGPSAGPGRDETSEVCLPQIVGCSPRCGVFAGDVPSALPPVPPFPPVADQQEPGALPLSPGSGFLCVRSASLSVPVGLADQLCLSVATCLSCRFLSLSPPDECLCSPVGYMSHAGCLLGCIPFCLCLLSTCPHLSPPVGCSPHLFLPVGSPSVSAC